MEDIKVDHRAPLYDTIYCKGIAVAYRGVIVNKIKGKGHPEMFRSKDNPCLDTALAEVTAIYYLYLMEQEVL